MLLDALEMQTGVGALPIITFTLTHFFIFLEKIKTGLLATNFSTLFPTIFRFPVLARQSYLWLHPGTHFGSVSARIQASGTTPISLLSALAPVLLCDSRQCLLKCF